MLEFASIQPSAYKDLSTTNCEIVSRKDGSTLRKLLYLFKRSFQNFFLIFQFFSNSKYICSGRRKSDLEKIIFSYLLSVLNKTNWHVFERNLCLTGYLNLTSFYYFFFSLSVSLFSTKLKRIFNILRVFFFFFFFVLNMYWSGHLKYLAIYFFFFFCLRFYTWKSGDCFRKNPF